MKNLIIVACHGIYNSKTGFTKEAIAKDENWCKDYKSEGSIFLRHIEEGIKLANADPDSVLIFSGGNTRVNPADISEAASYREIARHCIAWEGPCCERPMEVEECATDSFENLAFGLSRYHQIYGKYPEKVSVVSWQFKENRFLFHWEFVKALGIAFLDKTDFIFNGVREKPPAGYQKALSGEAKTLVNFSLNPYSQAGILLELRQKRQPAGYMSPVYTDPCFMAIKKIREQARSLTQIPITSTHDFFASAYRFFGGLLSGRSNAAPTPTAP